MTSDPQKVALSKACPQRLATGLVGAVVVVAGSILQLTVRTRLSGNMGAIAVIVSAFLAMAIMEIFVFRVYRRQFDFTKEVEGVAKRRQDIARRMAALGLCLGLAWSLYWVLGEYGLKFSGIMSPRFEESWYKQFFHFFIVATLGAPLVALPYFYICSAYGRWSRDEDEFLILWNGYCCCFQLKRPDDRFLRVLRSLVVKFFFIPLMTVFLVKNVSVFEARWGSLIDQAWIWDTASVGRAFSVIYEGLFLVDVNIAVLGYICCFRILDSHIRSSEPSFLGWALALACYPPFNTNITGVYLSRGANTHNWMHVLSGNHLLYIPVGVLILLLVWIYLYGTIAFAFRFSNLTNRGIICRGPYAWVRHPAYAAKNLTWWLLSLPFLVSPLACIRLVLLNAIYVGRAITEERHLSRDPVYREYMKKVKWRFIPGII